MCTIAVFTCGLLGCAGGVVATMLSAGRGRATKRGPPKRAPLSCCLTSGSLQAGGDLFAVVAGDRRRAGRDRGLGRLLDREEEALDRRRQGADPVHLLRDDPTAVLERDRVAVVVDRAERLVHLDEL